MEASDVSRLKELEEENCRPKKMYVDSQLGNEILREAMQKNREAIAAEVDGSMGSEK